jgi:hypothetical protein
MKSEEFDRAFDDGEDVTSQLDMSAARRPGLEQRRVNVDFPVWMIESLDREARRLGVNRQSIIKVWLAERLERGVSPALGLDGASVKVGGRPSRGCRSGPHSDADRHLNTGARGASRVTRRAGPAARSCGRDR